MPDDIDLPSDHWVACERHCRRFETAWQIGAAQNIEEFLPATAGTLRETVLRELVHLDLAF